MSFVAGTTRRRPIYLKPNVVLIHRMRCILTCKATRPSENFSASSVFDRS